MFDCREKKREREREELWKKLNDLEISRSNTKIKNDSDSTQSLPITQNNMSAASGINPTSMAPTSIAASSSTNQSAGATTK